jgi:hypothetical protein
MPLKLVPADPLADLQDLADSIRARVVAAPVETRQATFVEGVRELVRLKLAGGDNPDMQFFSIELEARGTAFAAGLTPEKDPQAKEEIDALIAFTIAETMGEPAPAKAITATDEWPEPLPLPESTEPVQDLPPDLLPLALRPYLEAFAASASVPLCMPAIPAMVTLGSLIGRKIAIKPDPHSPSWNVIPNPWGMIIAPPGLLKSAAMDAGMSPLHDMVGKAREQYEQDERFAKPRRIALEAKLSQCKRAKTASETEIQGILDEQEKAQVVQRRYFVQDATIEKLGEILRDNPRGVLVVRDELSGWWRGLDRPGHEGDREFFLEAWNGTNSFTVDRIGRGTIYIKGLCLSIIGTVQPGKLSEYVQGAIGNGAAADGLLQRFQMAVWPDRLPEWIPAIGPCDPRLTADAENVYAYLDNGVPVTHWHAEDAYIPFVRFDPDAQSLFAAWRNELELRLRAPSAEKTPAFTSHLAKYRSLMPCLSLLLHLADGGRGAVPIAYARKGAVWCDYLESHARKIYGAELTPGKGSSRVLAEKIAAGVIFDGMTIRFIKQAEWAGLSTNDEVESAIAELVKLHRVKVETLTPVIGRPSRVLRISPKGSNAI